MSALIKCDGCGKETKMLAGRSGDWIKPDSWYQRADNDGIQDACSRECIEIIAKETKKTSIISPF